MASRTTQPGAGSGLEARLYARSIPKFGRGFLFGTPQRRHPPWRRFSKRKSQLTRWNQSGESQSARWNQNKKLRLTGRWDYNERLDETDMPRHSGVAATKHAG